MIAIEQTQDNGKALQDFLRAAYEPMDCIIFDPLVISERLWFYNSDDLEETATTILKSNEGRKRQGLFGVNPRLINQTGRDGTDYARLYYADFDDVKPDAALKQIIEAKLPTPSIVVMSGTGTHCYWKLFEAEYDLAEWEHRQEWIANAVGSDTAVKDRQRLSRLPGTLNTKKEYEDNPPRTLLIHCDGELRYSWKDLQPADLFEPTVQEPPTPAPKRELKNGELRPGDDFNLRGKFEDVLPEGWRPVGKINPKGYQAWTHGIDGKTTKSATVRIGDESHAPAIYPFSTTQTDLEPNQWHTLFHVYAILKHGGKHTPAANDLAEQGFGKLPSVGYELLEDGTLTTTEAPTAVATLKPATLIPGAADLANPGTHTDIGLGKRLVFEAGGRLRYSMDRGIWHWFDGRRWKDDRKGVYAKRIAKRSAEILWQSIGGLTPTKEAKAAFEFARKANQRSGVDNAVSLAMCEQHFEVTSEEFDADPWVLNCENGLLDLKTRQLRQHDPSDLVTKLANVTFDDSAECPLWRQFVDTITCGDNDLAAFLQRSFGLALSADQSEQAVWFHHGDGSNGKGTFLSIMDAILGDYAASTNVNAFSHKGQEKDRAKSAAALIGRRLVFAQEIDEGSKLSEQTVKELTGSDAVAYRKLYEDEAVTYPTWHIHLAVNEMLQIHGRDHGIWRRVKIVPWLHKFEGEGNRPRGEVQAEFLAESSGILNWLLDGLQDWQQGGLQEPQAVLAAHADYKSESDHLQRWIDEQCDTNPHAVTKAQELYESYGTWCQRSHVSADSQTKFGRELEKKGYRKEKPTHGAFRRMTLRHGIALRMPEANFEGF